MTIFSLQKFHQKAKNPRKRPIVSKFDVPKVPELYAGSPAAMATELDEKGPKLTIRGPIRKKYEKKQVCYC